MCANCGFQAFSRLAVADHCVFTAFCALFLGFLERKLSCRHHPPPFCTEKISSGKVKINIFKKYKLDQVVEAHKDLEGRKILGPAVILP